LELISGCLLSYYRGRFFSQKRPKIGRKIDSKGIVLSGTLTIVLSGTLLRTIGDAFLLNYRTIGDGVLRTIGDADGSESLASRGFQKP